MFDTKRIIAATTALAMSLCTACGADEGGSTLSNNPVVLTDMGGTSTSNNTTPEDMPDGMTPDGGMTSGDDMDMDQTDPPDQDMETPPTACMRDGDCTAPQVCTVDTSTGSAQCTDPLGPNDTGSACLDGAECQSGLCVNGACAEPCTGDADCPNGFECTTQSVPLDGGGVADLNVCTEAPTPCLADPDCTDPEVCVIDRSGADPELLCQDPVPGASDLGESCNADNECRSGLCLEQVCSRPCERPIDCSQDGSFICEPTEVTTGTGMTSTVNVCRPKPATQCLSDSDCAGSERCIASKSSTAVEFVCDDPNASGSEEGASCAQDSDCAQNLCLDGTCAAPCQQNGDCTAPDFSCELTDVPVGNNLTDSAQVCVPPVTCTERDECKLNEVCYVRRAQQDIESVCRGGNAGGGSLGQVCSRDSECAANLCYDGRFGQVCSAPCKDDTDCGAAGYTCRTVDVATAGGGTASASICAPDDPPACASNNDCQTGTTCAIVPNTAGNALTSVCIPSKGKLATGVACAMDSECDSEVCLDGSCAAPLHRHQPMRCQPGLPVQQHQQEQPRGVVPGV